MVVCSAIHTVKSSSSMRCRSPDDVETAALHRGKASSCHAVWAELTSSSRRILSGDDILEVFPKLTSHSFTWSTDIVAGMVLEIVCRQQLTLYHLGTVVWFEITDAAHAGGETAPVVIQPSCECTAATDQ